MIKYLLTATFLLLTLNFVCFAQKTKSNEQRIVDSVFGLVEDNRSEEIWGLCDDSLKDRVPYDSLVQLIKRVSSYAKQKDKYFSKKSKGQTTSIKNGITSRTAESTFTFSPKIFGSKTQKLVKTNGATKVKIEFKTEDEATRITHLTHNLNGIPSNIDLNNLMYQFTKSEDPRAEVGFRGLSKERIKELSWYNPQIQIKEILGNYNYLGHEIPKLNLKRNDKVYFIRLYHKSSPDLFILPNNWDTKPKSTIDIYLVDKRKSIIYVAHGDLYGFYRLAKRSILMRKINALSKRKYTFRSENI